MRRIIILSLFVASVATAQSVTTDPVGFATTSLLGSSDTFVSSPFTRVPEFVGAISSTTASTITVPGTPWTANQFVYGTQPTQHNHYYVLIGQSATKEGHTYAITGNTTNTLTVATTALDDASGIPASTQITIIPNWTPATVFPASDAGVSFTATTSPPTYQTLIRVPNDSSPGINLPYTNEYYFNSGAWQKLTNGVANGVGDDDALLPDGYFVVRNANGALTKPLTNLGAVLLKKISSPLLTAASPGQDNPVGIVRPLDVALNATGLSGAFGPSDQLLLFNNAQIAFDKTPSATYSYDTHWRLSGDATLADRGSDIIPLGTGFIVRKIGGTSAFWTNPFPVSAVSAVSRKSHTGGVVGTFDVHLPLAGTPGIECRSGGASNDHQIVFTFPIAVTFTSASVTSGTGSVASSAGSGTTGVTVNLTGVTDAQYVTVTLLGVNDGTNTNDVAVRMGVLIGDVNASGRVDGSDVSLIRQQNFQTTFTQNPPTFREDVNASGRIDGRDVSIARQNNFHSLPP